MNSLFVLKLYRHNGTWCFDDSTRGLLAEPFVAGVPEMIDQYVPSDQETVMLTFSTSVFPGAMGRLDRVRSEHGGTVYKHNGKEGWLCPALFKYYPQAPATIWFRLA